MKRRSSLLFFVMLMVVFPLTAWIGQREVSQAAESDNHKNIARYEKSLQTAEAVLIRLGQLDEKRAELPDRKGAQIAIDDGLKLLSEILKDKEQAQKLGFQISNTKIDLEGDNAFPVFEIGQDDLRDFHQGADAEEFLFYTNQLLLPVAEASITIRLATDKKDNLGHQPAAPTWRPTRWGRKNLIHDIKEAQKHNPGAKPGFLVAVPSLNRNFLGYKDAEAFRMIPLFEDRLLRFKKGQAIPAEQVLETLSEEARNAKDRPR